MDKKQEYIVYLESIIQEKLMPVYNAYYISKGEIPPSIELHNVNKTKPIAALLRGFSMLTPDEREPRNN